MSDKLVTIKPLRLNGLSYNGNLNIGNLEDINIDEDETLSVINKVFNGNGLNCSCVKIVKGVVESQYYFEISDYSITYDKIKAFENTLRLYLKSKALTIELSEEVVGFVVVIPNSKSRTVPFANILEYSPIYPCKKFENPMLLALGVDSTNNPIFLDLEEVSPLLIVGDLDFGKTTCITSIITSLLYSRFPSMLNLVLMDLSGSAFSKFNNLKYYLNEKTIIDKNGDAINMLYNICSEMEWRYSKFKEKNVNNIGSYNQCFTHPSTEPFDQIVVVIDEVGELLAFNGKISKELLGKIAQSGKSAGIHLIIGTSNPSYTKSLSFGINSKICFSVSSEEHSKMVLGENGAEKLIGEGDGLLKRQGQSITHFQTCSLLDGDIEKITDFINNKMVTPKEDHIPCTDSLQEKLKNYKELLND